MGTTFKKVEIVLASRNIPGGMNVSCWCNSAQAHTGKHSLTTYSARTCYSMSMYGGYAFECCLVVTFFGIVEKLDSKFSSSPIWDYFKRKCWQNSRDTLDRSAVQCQAISSSPSWYTEDYLNHKKEIKPTART